MDADGIVVPRPDDHLRGMIFCGERGKKDGNYDAVMGVGWQVQASRSPILQKT